MTTLTIELPEMLAQQVEARGISSQQLEEMIIRLVELYLQEYDTLEEQSTQPSPGSTWSNGEAFARRVIANNRKLFEALAKL